MSKDLNIKKQSKPKNINALFGGEKQSTTDAKNITDLLGGEGSTVKTPILKRGTFSDREDTNKGVNLEDYKEYLGVNTIINDSADKTRALNQSNWEQTLNGVKKFLPNVALEILNQTGALLDIEDYANSDKEVGNWLSTWALEQKEKVNAANPIYRENPGEALDVSDYAWWVENGSSLVESVTAFAAVGAVSGGASMVGLTRGAKALEWLTVIGKGASATNKGKKLIQGASTLNTAFLLNHAEGMGIAASVYGEVYKTELKRLQAEGNENADALAKDKASKKAVSALDVNKINILLNLTSASLFVKTPRLTRQLRNKTSLTKTLKHANIEGLQEGAEETINMLAEKQALDDNYNITKGLQDVFSAEGAESALLGYIGGAGQTAITNAGRRIKLTRDKYGIRNSAYNLQNQAFNEQNESKERISVLTKGTKIADNTDALMRAEEVFNLQKEIVEAYEKGDTKKVDKLKGKLLSNQAFDAFANGTTEQLLTVFEGIKNLDPTAAKEKGLDETTYKESAEDAITFIEALEDEYNKSFEYLNTSDVYSNRAQNVKLRIANAKLENNKSKLQEQAKQDLRELGLTEEEIVLNENDNFVLNKKYLAQAKQLESVSNYTNLLEVIKQNKATQKELATRYIELTSNDTQRKIKNKITEEKANKKKKTTKKEASTQAKKQTAKKKKVEQEVTAAPKTPTPTSSNKGEIVSKVEPFVASDSNVDALVTLAEQGNKVLESKIPTEKKVAKLKKAITALTPNLNLPGIKGMIAQYNKAIRVLEGEEEQLKSNQETTTTQQQAIKDKLQGVADTLVDETDDNSVITEENYSKIDLKVRTLGDALNTMADAGYDVSDFKLVADAMREAVGEEKFINIFEDFKAVYNLTDVGSHPITDTYESLYLTDEERQGVVDHQKMLEINTFLQDFYNLTNAEFEAKRDAVLKTYIEEQGYTVYNSDTLNEFKGFKVVEGFNKIAYLAKRYENNIDVSTIKFNVLDFFISKEDIDRELNKNVDEVLLDPANLQAGEKITFKVLNEVIYDDGTIVTKSGEVIKDGEITQRNPVDIAPIALFYKGKQIKGAYLHTVDWINDKNIAQASDVNRQKNLIKKIRQTILASEKDITTTINERKDGWLMSDVNGNKDLVSINLPKVKIAVGKDDNLVQGDTTITTANKEIINGLPYAIIPVNKGKHIGIPVQPMLLNEKPEYITSILNAVRIYLSGTFDERADKIYTESGLNLTNISDLETFISGLIYLSPYKTKDTAYYTYDEFKNMLNQTKDTLSIVRIVDGEIQYGRGLGVNGSVGYVNKKELNSLPTTEGNNVRQATIDAELIKLKDVLENNTYINVSKELLNKNYNVINITETEATVSKEIYNDFIKKHLKTDIYSATLPNGKEVYTIQGTIEFDDNFALGTKKVIKQPEATPEEKATRKVIVKGDNKYTFGQIKDDDTDLAPKTLTTEQEQDIKATTPESLLIQGVTLNTQNTIINHLASTFLKYGIKDGDALKAFNFLSNDFPDTLTAAYRFYNDSYKETGSLQDLKSANVIKTLKENYSKLSELAINNLKQVNNLDINFTEKTVEVLEQKFEEFETTEENSDVVLDATELNNWDSDASFRENMKEKMSTNLRNFFSYIEDAEINADNQIVPKEGILGIIETVPTDVVINDLNAILAYHNDLNNEVVLEPTFANMIKILENWVDKKPYLINVLENLDDADEKTQNEFVQVMSKHYTNHLFVSKNEKGKYFVNNSDNNSIVKVIQQNWLNNIYNNGVVVLNNKDVFVLNNTRLKEITTDAKLLIEKLTENTPDKYTFAKKVLTDLGLNFDDAVVKLLIDRGIKHKGGFKTLLGLLKDSDGAIKNYINTLNKLKGKDLQENHPFKDNSSLRMFAREIGKENPIYFANSFKDVRGKSYFGYSNNKFLVDRVKGLKHNRNGLLEKLKAQPFTSNSLWVNELINNPKFLEHFTYFTFDGISSKFKEEGIKLDYASPSEIEEAKLALFYSKTKFPPKNKGIVPLYIVNLFYPTTSNKTVQYGLQTLGEEWGKGLVDGKLHIRQQHRLFDILVQPEINRILSLQSDPDRYNIKAYDKGGLMFHFLPALNSMKELWNKDGSLKASIGTDVKLKNKVLFEIRKYAYELVEDKLAKWNDYGFIKEFEEVQTYTEEKGAFTVKPTKLKFSNRYPDDGDGARREAYNFVLNYLVANVNIAQTFTTDPAFYWKSNQWKSVLKREEIQDKLIKDGYGETVEEVQDYIKNLKDSRKELLPYYSEKDWIQEHEDTYNNIGKRLAADAAPGVDIPNSPNDTFTLGYMKDSERPVYLYSYYKALLGANASDYLKANSTDAQEFTTLKEHLHILNKQGKLSTKDMRAILLAEQNDQKLSDVQLNLVFQPLKPVYVQNVWKDGIERRVYVKSSSFPLFKQLTKGLEIDKLRVAMVKQTIDRVAFESAVKIGGTNTPTEVFEAYDVDKQNAGNIKNIFKINIIGTLTREGFKIQQEIPYNEDKDYINDGTQQIKLLTANIRDIDGFKIPNDTESSYTGQEIQDELDKAYIELFEINYKALADEIEYDVFSGTVNTVKLAKILQKEAVRRDYPLYELEALNAEIDENGDGNFVVPLWLTGVAGKLEAMLNSIVNNRVRKLKPKGDSYVLGSSEGFKPAFKEGIEAQEVINNTTGIVWDREWYAETGGQLAPMRIEDANGNLYGEKGFDSETSFIKHAEILIPFKFKDSKGNLLNVEDYTTEDGFIDINKISPELLKVFGFRIPTQYLNSMSAIKIVGFLPKSSGNLLLAPADWTVQMGSDFDVDKLYSNNYNTQYNDGTGAITSYREGDNRKKILENRILDLHFAILENPNPEVQKRVMKPLDFGDLQTLAEEIYPYVDNRLKGVGISESYQSWKYLNARAGKSGIGVFSTDNTFIAQVQNKNIYLQKKGEKYYEEFEFKIGGRVSNRISEAKTNTGKKDKTDVVSAFQSLAVDDENEQGLFKLNINSNTFDAIRTLITSGFEEDIIIYFINQPIIRKYVQLKVKADDSVTNYSMNDLRLDILKEFPIKGEYSMNDKEFHAKYGNTSKEQLLLNLKEQDTNTNVQRYLLSQFIELTEFGKDIQYVQSAINTHSAGFGKDLFYSTIKEGQILGLNNYARVANSANLIGDYFRLEQVKGKALDVLASSDGINALLYKWNIATKDEDKKAVITELQELGYKPVTTISDRGSISHTIQFIKPDTLAGIVSTNALFFNNNLWKRYFPYNEVGVNKSLDGILEVSGRGERLNTQATNKRKAFDNLKSYSIATIANTFTDGEVVAERNRLLLDTKDNMSLATIIQVLRETGKLNNAFINRLELELMKEVLPSSITYQAATAENIDERHLHSAFSAMLLNNTIDLGEFNGIKYTPQKIAQDLITQQLLSGGVQKATQFIKYIPINYLKSIGYYKALDSINYLALDEVNASYVKNQYIQHNPKSVQLTETQLEDIQANYKFYNGKTLMKRVNKSAPFKLPSVFSMKNEKALSGFNLYFYNDEIKGWEQKDTLGTKNLIEYNGNIPFGTTVIKSNKTPKVVAPTLPKKPKAIKEVLDITKDGDNEVDVIYAPTNEVEAYFDLESENTIENKVGFMLDKIITNEDFDGFTTLMAKEVIKNLGIIKDYRLIISNTLTAKGSHNLNDKTIKLNPSAHNSIEDFGKTVLEEVIHALTKKAIIENNTGEVARLKSLLNTAQREVINYLNTELKVDGQAAVDTVITKLANREALTEFEADIIYPVINEAEFVGRLFKSKKLQELLNNAPSSIKGKSILDTIVDFIREALNSLGLVINKDSALDYALSDILTLINQGNPTNAQSKEISKVEQVTRSVEQISKQFGLETANGELTEFTEEKADEIVDWINTNVSNLEAIRIGSWVSLKSIDKYDTTNSIVSRYSNSIVKANRNKLYVFGDNTDRRGTGGQAQIRHNENAFGIATKIHPTNNADAFMTDASLESNKKVITEDITKIKADGRPIVFPKDGFGTGLARLKQKAPRTYAYLKSQLLKEFNFDNDKGEFINKEKPQLNLFDSTEVTTPTINKEYELFPDVYANKEQTSAINAMKDFLSPSNESKVFTLVGRGGTGKTTIIKKVLQDISSHIPVKFVAPTHKAKNILSESVGRKASTLESALLITLDETTGKFRPDENKRGFHMERNGVETPLELAKIIIIDEGSMVSDVMLQELLTRGHGAKIIFMGDNVQLPPVKQDTDSKVFKHTKATLLERMRQGEASPIVPLTDLVANNVEAITPVLDPITNRVSKITKDKTEGILFVNNAKEMLQEYAKDIKADPTSTKVITFNNQDNNSPQSVGRLNPILRKIVFPNSTNLYEEGEILMAYDTFVDPSTSAPIIENSMDYQIVAINQVPVSATNSKMAFSKARGKREISFTFEGYEVTLKNIFTKEKVNTILLTKESSEQHKKAVQQAYNEKDFQKGFITKSLVPNLLYGYAITSHKSQGSTYKNAYVMADNILGGNMRTNKEKSQSLYVAVSRASDKLVIHSGKNVNVATETIESTKDDLAPAVQANTERGKANPLLLSYNNRIKRLKKNIDKAEAQNQLERVEALKEDLEQVVQKRNETLTINSLRNRSADNSDLYYKGIQDLSEARTMLNGNRPITLEDTLYIRKILHFWQKATSVLFTEQDRKSEVLLSDFKSIEAQAEVLEDTLQVYEEKFMNDFIKKYGHNINVQEIFEHFKDINGLTAKALDISRSGNELLNSVFLAVKNANIDALDEGNELLRDLDTLEDEVRTVLKNMGNKELYEVFRQRNKNGKLTGHLVKRFTNEFSRAYYKKVNNLFKTNTSVNFDSILTWGKANLKNVNLNYLFATNLSAEDKVKAEKYKTSLKEELGDNHYAEFIEKQGKQIKNYQRKLRAKLQSMATKYNTDTTAIATLPEYKKEINNWDVVNSPYRFYKYMQTGLPTALSEYKNFSNTNFITILPKNSNVYDTNYSQIESNEALLNFYKYYTKIDEELKTYLPEDVRRNLSYTGIPFIKKTILNLYKDKGMKIGLTPIWDNIKESVRSVEESVVASKSIDPVTNKQEKGLKINLSGNDTDAVLKYIDLKVAEAKIAGIEVTEELLKEWREEKIDELAQLKSYDLAKILKVYALTTLSYKHKSKIEDSIELAQNILNSQQEYIRTNTGEYKVDDVGHKLAPKNAEHSFTNLKSQFEYFVDSFKGGGKKDEGVTKTLVLTASEKIEKKQLEKTIGELKQAFNDGNITSADYEKSNSLLQAHLDSLGGYAVNSKRGDNVLKWVQLVKMGWNLMSSVANVGFGYIANRLEGSGGQLYTNAQLTEAYKLTTNSIWKNWTFNHGENKTAKKIRSMMDKWDILKDASHEMFQRPLDMDLGKKTKWLSPYNLTQRTEYVNQAPIMIAMMMNTTLRSLGIEKDGNLWEAYDEKGNWKSEFGKEVNVKTTEGIKLLRNKIDQVNKMNHGNYDPTSAIALKKEFWGRAISQFRTWMFEGYATRFEGKKEDALLGARKGRYISVKDFYSEVGFTKATSSLLKGLTRSLTLGTAFKGNDFEEFKKGNLENVDIANLRKAMTEIAMYTTLYTSYLMLKAMSAGLDDDDDERKYALNLMINQGMRLKTDIIFYLNPGEFKNLLRDLVPATSVITDATQFLGAVAKFAQNEDEIGTGIYSGNSRLLRETMQLLPIGTQVYKTINYGLQTFDKR